MAPSQVADQAGRAQPQTTVETAQGGPFIQHSQEGKAPQYFETGKQFGAMVNPILPSAPGYARKWRINFSAVGGAATAAAGTPDAPFSVVQNVLVLDGFGTQLISGPGWDILYALPKYGGQLGLGLRRDVKNLPSFSPISASTGDFSFSTCIPLEFVKSIGCIGVANSSIQPKLNFQLASSSAVYSVAPTTLPTINVRNYLDFYWLPQGSNVVPPGEGTTQQWVAQAAVPAIGSGMAMPISIPRAGGYISTIILIARDATGARVDVWPDPMYLIVDGVPWVNGSLSDIEDDMAIAFQGVTRDTGVIAVSRKTSLNQEDNGLLDTGMTYLSTTPGTSIQVGGTWGAIANPPVTLTAYLAQVVPVGSLVTGLPEAS